MAVRLAINGLGRISAQLVRVVNEGGFSDLFEIAEIHDAAGSEGIVRALRHDAIYGPFPGELALDGDTLKIGEQSIALSSNIDAKNATWPKSDIALVIVDGSAANDATALDQHLKKGAKRIILPAASPLADINLGIGVNEASYDPEKHNIIASAGGAPSGIALFCQVLDRLSKVRSGGATIIAPASGSRPLLDAPAARGGDGALWPVLQDSSAIYEQLIDRLANRLSVSEIETAARAVGAISFGVWLEQKVTPEALRDAVKSAEDGDELIGLIASCEDVSASTDVLHDSRTVLIDWSGSNLLYETFVSVTAWYDAEWGAACRLADTLALMCEEGIPGTA